MDAHSVFGGGMIEFLKCLFAGLASFAGIGVILGIFWWCQTNYPEITGPACIALFVIGMALWLGATLRGLT